MWSGPMLTPLFEAVLPNKYIHFFHDCIGGGDGVYPKYHNYGIQLYPKLQKCLSRAYPTFQARIPVFSSFVVLHAQVPSPSFRFGSSQTDAAILFEAASYSPRCKG